jgi:hypothetical protein
VKEKLTLTLKIIVSGLTLSISSYVEVREIRGQKIIEFITGGNAVAVQLDTAKEAVRKLAKLLKCIPKTTCAYHQLSCSECRERTRIANEE